MYALASTQVDISLMDSHDRYSKCHTINTQAARQVSPQVGCHVGWYHQFSLGTSYDRVHISCRTDTSLMTATPWVSPVLMLYGRCQTRKKKKKNPSVVSVVASVVLRPKALGLAASNSTKRQKFQKFKIQYPETMRRMSVNSMQHTLTTSSKTAEINTEIQKFLQKMYELGVESSLQTHL